MEIQPQMTQCPQCGQYYNAALHSACPHCGGGAFPHTAPPSGAAPDGGQGEFAHTMPPSGAGPEGGFNVTIPVGSNAREPASPFAPTVFEGTAQGPVEPVVGWLVCIEGPVRGTDFRLHAGYNYIGREVGDIHIHGDQQVSRENHAMLAFDSRDQIYYVGPATGRNLIRLNDKPVLNAVEIKSYDILTVGATRLLFVALCGEQFRWGEESGNG